MRPRIQYVTSCDGVRIAYTIFGRGPPIVFPANAAGGIELFFTNPFHVPWAEQIGESGFSAVAYDGRGTGGSDRGVTDMSQAARLADLEAVVDKLSLDSFPLIGRIHGCVTAIAYAAKHPQRVSHLVLESAYARGADYYANTPILRAIKALSEMAEDNWEFFTLTLSNWLDRFRHTDGARKYAAIFRRAMEPTDYRRFIAGCEQADVTDLLAQIQVPTLVISQPDSVFSLTLDFTRAVTAAIPGAQQLTVEEGSAVLRAALDFIREESPIPAPTSDIPSGTAIILFADIVESTALTERMGDAAFRAKARELGPALRALVRDCGGTPVEGPTLGDGVLAVFTSAREGIEAALRCAGAGDEADLSLHLGLHAGDVSREKDPDGRDNVYGGAVNIAARISGLSAPGEVLVSETVRSLARTSAGVSFEDRGEQALKGVGEAVRVWAVLRESQDERESG